MSLITAKKGLKALLCTAAICWSSLSSADTKPVPSHTYFQAYKVVKAQYPNAEEIKVTPFSADSINGVVGQVINASTRIDFVENGVSKRVVMLPDGQHLIIGDIVKSGAGAKPQESKPTQALTATPHKPQHAYKPQGPSAKAALDRIEMGDRLKRSAFNYDQYRMTPNHLDSAFEGATVDPSEFTARLENHKALVTGHGPNHIYIFTDPNCPNCQKEYAKSKQYEDIFTFHWVPIYALTKSPTLKQVALVQESDQENLENLELIMTNPQATSSISVDTTDSVANRLRQHQMLFYNIKDKSTPVTVYRNKDGLPTIINGYSPKLLDLILADKQ